MEVFFQDHGCSLDHDGRDGNGLRPAPPEILARGPGKALPVVGAYADKATTIQALAACYGMPDEAAERVMTAARRIHPESVLVDPDRGMRLFWRREPGTVGIRMTPRAHEEIDEHVQRQDFGSLALLFDETTVDDLAEAFQLACELGAGTRHQRPDDGHARVTVTLKDGYRYSLTRIPVTPVIPASHTETARQVIVTAAQETENGEAT